MSSELTYDRRDWSARCGDCLIGDTASTRPGHKLRLGETEHGKASASTVLIWNPSHLTVSSLIVATRITDNDGFIPST